MSIDPKIQITRFYSTKLTFIDYEKISSNFIGGEHLSCVCINNRLTIFQIEFITEFHFAVSSTKTKVFAFQINSTMIEDKVDISLSNWCHVQMAKPVTYECERWPISFIFKWHFANSINAKTEFSEFDDCILCPAFENNNPPSPPPSIPPSCKEIEQEMFVLLPLEKPIKWFSPENLFNFKM